MSIIYVCSHKPFGSLLQLSQTNHIILKTLNSKHDETKVCFKDQISQPLEIENRVNLTMAIT